MNQILLNFSSQDHEDFVEWKRGRGNGHVNEQEVDNLKKQITSLESSQNPENTQQNENVKLWVGVSCGIVVGLVGMMVWLVMKGREE